MEENKTAEDPKITSYYLIKTIENKWGVAYWDGNKFWDDPNQDGKVSFGIKREWIKEFYLLPDGKNQELTQQQSANAELKKQNEELVENLKISGILLKEELEYLTHWMKDIDSSHIMWNHMKERKEFIEMYLNTPPKN